MADMNTSDSGRHQRGGQRSKKSSTRVDMTPMVDLGFLLITFFMLTTTLAQPKTMDLTMPANGPSMPVAESKSLTVLLTGNNRVAYYEGDGSNLTDAAAIKYSSFSAKNGIGDVIREKQKRVATKYGSPDQMMVLIKADDHAQYDNVVNVMDEMLINRVARYAIVDISPAETTYLNPMP